MGIMSDSSSKDVSSFILAVMPNATEKEQREAEKNLDRFLDVLDAIAQRLAHEELYRDKNDAGARLTTSLTGNI